MINFVALFFFTFLQTEVQLDIYIIIFYFILIIGYFYKFIPQ